MTSPDTACGARPALCALIRVRSMDRQVSLTAALKTDVFQAVIVQCAQHVRNLVPAAILTRGYPLQPPDESGSQNLLKGQHVCHRTILSIQIPCYNYHACIQLIQI